MLPKLGIIAGRGKLPGKIIDACMASRRDIFVIALNGETELATIPNGVSHAWVDLSAVGHTISLLKSAKVTQLVLIGPIGRPDFGKLRPDWHGIKLLPKIVRAARHGDDALIKVIVEDLEHEGFTVLAAESLLSDLIAPTGNFGIYKPDAGDQADIDRGMNIINTIGELDIGQAAVVRNGYVLAVEAAEGTDAMLLRCRDFRTGEFSTGKAGVLVKRAKPKQDRRVDLPTIGVATVHGVSSAGLKGIAIEAGGTLVVDQAAVIKAADAAGIFILGVTLGGRSCP